MTSEARTLTFQRDAGPFHGVPRPKATGVDQLRVAASRAFANAALRLLDDAERQLQAMAKPDDEGRVEAPISQARNAMSDSAYKGDW